MKNNLSLLLALIGGIFVGMSGIAPDWMHDESLPMMVLCVLILQVGIGVGAMDNLTAMFRSIDIKMLLLPLFTIVGTLLFTLFAFFIFHHESMFDVMALGSGFGYYSVKSGNGWRSSSYTIGHNRFTDQCCARTLVAIFLSNIDKKRWFLGSYLNSWNRFNGCMLTINPSCFG